MRDAIIIGAGPAGLSAARILAGAGRDVLVLERNPEPGGLPRFCGHLGWGMLDFHRLWTGPAYARALVQAAGRAEIRTGASVTALLPGGGVEVSLPEGIQRLQARAVLLAAGIREMPRGARLLSGTRPWGVVSTGAFQEMVYAGGVVPFRHPVVVGTELVSFSALLTARHAGIRPLVMIEENDRITARRPGDWVARHLLGVPVRLGTKLLAIEGQGRVEAVRLAHAGGEERLACDGVILSGRFVPEATLARAGHLTVDPATGGPLVDSAWRCSDPAFFAAGNVLRSVEHSGAAALEGRAAAHAMLRALAGELPSPDAAVPVTPGGALRYVYPQRLLPGAAPLRLYARAAAEHRGRLRVLADGRLVHERRLHALPERRLTLTLPAGALQGVAALSVDLA
ncbi:FAD/NAD(P)-binding oxidoreductase [Roseomonas sp. E05]|uniref:NAD(P)/FAD-dependent oxidoreductase n=1 Tax=Roseomonas sp. E05 TaxID=3046310 RepID=UPI0024BA2B84|nr:FAD/NAD(P)-binding oxidoreductase [Roseomonas sp. E05]MDJ0391550.1 FAD/NAD(P)-binding oxidoreductase [Roseomonas sp. E05]